MQRVFSLVITLLCATSPALYALESLPQPSFDQKISELMHQTLPQATLGMVVMDPETQHIVYARRDHENFHPASNTKLFTASAALQYLGSDYQYETSLRTLHPLKANQSIKGDLHVVFSGDPSFTSADLLTLFKQLQRQKITHITGNIVIDDSAFQGPYYGPGWTHDSIVWGYSAPISAIIIDENKIGLSLEKPQKRDGIIPIQKRAPYQWVKLDAKVKAVSREAALTQCQIHVENQNNDLQLHGCYAFDDLPTVLEIAVNSPRLLAQRWIEKDLAALKITLDGKIVFGNTPEHYQPVVIKKSAPLKTLLIPVLADSNNLYTECITKTLGHAYYGRGTFQSGARAIKAILNKNPTLANTSYRIVDGSGQSRYNLVSPLIITRLLHVMNDDPHRDDFVNALSVGGKSGTLQTRMQTEVLKEKISAKTGGATGTSTLSGYLVSKSGKPYIFSIMINQIEHNHFSQVKNVEDKICTLISEERWI